MGRPGDSSDVGPRGERVEHDDGLSPEEREKLRRIMVDHDRVMLTVFGAGNGDKGLLFRINSHLVVDKVERALRDKTDKRRSRIHFTLLGAVLTLLGGLLLAVVQMWLGGHKIVKDTPPPISQSRPQPPDATNGAAYTAATR